MAFHRPLKLWEMKPWLGHYSLPLLCLVEDNNIMVYFYFPASFETLVY